MRRLQRYRETGDGIPHEQVAAWLASIGTDNEFPSRKSPSLKPHILMFEVLKLDYIKIIKIQQNPCIAVVRLDGNPKQYLHAGYWLPIMLLLLAGKYHHIESTLYH